MMKPVRSGPPPWASILALILMLISGSVAASTDRTAYKDREGDVVVDAGEFELETLTDLDRLEDRKAPESKERLSCDIRELSVLENESYISYVIRTEGPVYSRADYRYIIAGYARPDWEATDPFDFMLVHNNGSTTYLLWEQGDFVSGPNVSRSDVIDDTLNITMHRSRFILKERSERGRVVAISVFETGGGSERFVDRVDGVASQDDEGFDLGRTEILAMEIAFIVFMFIALFILYNVWSKKKGEAVTGGVCPKCEGRLDPNIDFCPVCGAIIRGPSSDKGSLQNIVKEAPPPPEE